MKSHGPHRLERTRLLGRARSWGAGAMGRTRRRQSAVPLRDTRYYAERVRTAQLTPAPTSNDVIAVGHTITFERDDGRTQTYRIVGEDEANPSQASISHGSPVAIALIGKRVGDVV